MKHLLIPAVLTVIVASTSQVVVSAPTEEATLSSSATGIATMYAKDPLSRSMSFATGSEGGIFQDYMVKNRQSDIDFGHYYERGFTVAIEGGVKGGIVDLGSPNDLQSQYGYSETVGGGQGFASIRLEDGKFVILDDYQSQSTQPLLGAEVLEENQRGSNAHARVVDGHVYLVRLTSGHAEESDRIVKFIVIAHSPGESVTLRWAVL